MSNQSSRPKFSVVLIAKNEAKTLPRLMRSLREFQARGGEVVLVDTGSTDGTPEVARAHGCKVDEVGARFVTEIDAKLAEAINREFVVVPDPPVVAAGDRFFCYADARNYAASLASNDIVSMPDCDEEYTALDIDAVNRYIDEGYGQLEFLFVYAHDAMGRPAVQFLQCKMYDRRLLRWNPECVIHEVLQPIDPQAEIRRTQLPENVLKIEHWQDPTKPRSHYLPGLCWEVYKHPDNDRNMHYLGRELLYTRRYASAVQVLQRHIAMDRWKAEKAQSMIYLGDCLGGLGRPDEQAEWYFRAFHTDPTRREALLRLAGFYQHNRQATAVAAFAAAAMEIPWHAFYANLVAQYRDEPHAFRYWGRGWLGNIQGAQEDLLKCLEWNPFNATYLEHTKYYFPYADRLIDGWMLYPELLWLYETAERMQSVVEVGSWKGRSTHAIASGCHRGEVWAVDHFRGSKGEEVQHAEAANPDNIYHQFLNNAKELNNLHVLRMGSLEAAERFDDHSVDMVFIDAGHTYEDVKADIEAWLPKARILIAGHDFAPEWPGVRRAVTERFGQVGKHKTIWYRYVKEPLVSIVIPTLGREEQLQRLISLIETNAGWPLYEILVEVDDWPPNNQGVPRLVQRGVARARGELVMYLGTDCEPQHGFLLEAVHAMLRHFPAYDGLIGLNDGIYTSGQVATHWLAGKALLPLLDGEFFHTGYHHVGCDNELTARCRKLRRYVWCEQARINHHHFSVTGKELDETYRVGWQPELVERDRALLRQRAEQLGLDIEVDMRPRKIPRRAFSIWLGEEPPELVKVCLSSHRERLKGWEYRLLTLDNTRWIEDAYFRRAVEAKRWVKAADRLRLLELQRNGGVYLDADMELLTEIPHSLLVPSMLVAREENGFIANSVIGAVPGHPTLGRVLQRMEQADPEDDKVFENGMEIFSREVDASIAEGDQDILVVEPSVFFPFNHQTHKTTFTEKTIAYHHFMKSWAGGDD